MSNAFIFPGQGSQYIGMCYDIFKKFKNVRKRYAEANEILGYDISKISFIFIIVNTLTYSY